MNSRTRQRLVKQARQHYERRLFTDYGLDEQRHRRLGFFLLVHVRVDIRLIALLVVSERRPTDTLDTGRRRSVKWSRRTLVDRLTAASKRGLIDGKELKFAEEVNTARNGFLHFKVDRFKLPHYKGKDVTSEEGYAAFMQDAALWDANVPFPH